MGRWLDDAIRAAYGPALRDALTPTPFSQAGAEAERARRAAMTPEERRIEDLEHRYRELEERINTAISVLKGEHYCDG